MRWILLLFVSLSVMAEQKTPHRIRVTPDHDDLSGYQMTTELNIYNGSSYVNEFLEWESQEDFTFGAYLNNIPLGEEGSYRQTYIDDSYLGISKWWGKRDSLCLGISGQVGTQLVGTSMRRTPQNLLALTTAQLQIPLARSLRLSVGPYYANPAMSTVGHQVGAATNLVWFIDRSLRVEGTWYTGATNVSGGVFNGYFDLGSGAEFYSGIQVPASNSGNEFAGIIGFIVPLYNAGAQWED